MGRFLIPERASRKFDSLGRLTLPKGLRDRMEWDSDTEVEIYTATLDGRQCVCLAKPESTYHKICDAIDTLNGYGYSIEYPANPDEE